eukprot:m.53105 g.53105  ORF g.53105 m.53105 type:complete len:113 (+) comp9139_c0_seq4:155-493(+)
MCFQCCFGGGMMGQTTYEMTPFDCEIYITCPDDAANTVFRALERADKHFKCVAAWIAPRVPPQWSPYDTPLAVARKAYGQTIPRRVRVTAHPSNLQLLPGHLVSLVTDESVD